MAQANLGEAEKNVARDTPLVAQNAIPQKQLDTDQSTLAANQAQVDAAKAQMVQAELNLEWTKVYSPIDGIGVKPILRSATWWERPPRWRQSPGSIPSGHTSTSTRAPTSPTRRI